MVATRLFGKSTPVRGRLTGPTGRATTGRDSTDPGQTLTKLEVNQTVLGRRGRVGTEQSQGG